MSSLTPRDRELVALGAAMGSNCVPCIEYHIPESRKAGITDEEIREAIQHADRIRQVPARKTLQAALSKLPSAAGDAGNAGTTPAGECGAGPAAGNAGTSGVAQPTNAMVGLLAGMMAARCGPGATAGAPKSSAQEQTTTPASGEGCACA